MLLANQVIYTSVPELNPLSATEFALSNFDANATYRKHKQGGTNGDTEGIHFGSWSWRRRPASARLVLYAGTGRELAPARFPPPLRIAGLGPDDQGPAVPRLANLAALYSRKSNRGHGSGWRCYQFHFDHHSGHLVWKCRRD